jgi:Arc/MetJ-type ribon-helix-helix transcriptional regulator
MSAVVRLDEDLVDEIDRRAEAAGSGRSEVVRDALAASAASTAGTMPQPALPDTAPAELGRVDLVVPVRPESIAWLDELARV